MVRKFKCCNFYDTSFSVSWHHLLRRNPFIVRNKIPQSILGADGIRKMTLRNLRNEALNGEDFDH
jgi:hypothetical protein